MAKEKKQSKKPESVKLGKIELCKAIAAKCDSVAQKTIIQVVDAFQEVIGEEVMDKNNTVALSKLGIFKKRITAAREGFNPLAKKKIQIPEVHSLGFKCASSLRMSIDD